jgi:hypothetical protein
MTSGNMDHSIVSLGLCKSLRRKDWVFVDSNICYSENTGASKCSSCAIVSHLNVLSIY